MDWTYTSAGLPAENARVLAWVVPHELGADAWTDLEGAIRIVTRSGEDWFSDDGETDFDAQDVYAWMPLPDPPKRV